MTDRILEKVSVPDLQLVGIIHGDGGGDQIILQEWGKFIYNIAAWNKCTHCNINDNQVMLKLSKN